MTTRHALILTAAALACGTQQPPTAADSACNPIAARTTLDLYGLRDPIPPNCRILGGSPAAGPDVELAILTVSCAAVAAGANAVKAGHESWADFADGSASVNLAAEYLHCD